MKKNTGIIILTLALSVGAAQAGVIFSETFDTDGSIDDYTGAGKIFSAVIRDATAGLGTVEAGELNAKLTGASSSVGDGSDTRFYTHIDLGTAKPLLSVQMDFTGVQYSAASGPFQMYLGSFDTIADFDPGWNPAGSNRNLAKISVGGANPYPVNAFGSGSSTAGTKTDNDIGTAYTWTLFFNQSGSSQPFTGPDSGAYTLNDNSFTIFIDSTPLAQNVPNGTGGDSAFGLQGIVFNLGRNYDGGTSSQNLDNIIIRDDLAIAIPEPATLGLVLIALGLAAIPRFRR